MHESFLDLNLKQQKVNENTIFRGRNLKSKCEQGYISLLFVTQCTNNSDLTNKKIMQNIEEMLIEIQYKTVQTFVLFLPTQTEMRADRAEAKLRQMESKLEALRSSNVSTGFSYFH